MNFMTPSFVLGGFRVSILARVMGAALSHADRMGGHGFRWVFTLQLDNVYNFPVFRLV